MPEERTEQQAKRNAAAYMKGVNDAVSGRAFNRPDRQYSNEEERIAYRTGFYAELEMIEEDGEEG
ncbi:MAG: hypothetical protein M3Q49_08800 [Actinomycetota bacterium]|nr:hypothetical protein [Actinomycetota bacterium]